MKAKLIVSITVFMSAFSFGSYAQAEGVNPWIHCGIGALIFNKGDDTQNILAAISNITWDLGTTAVSSKISSQDSCAGAKNVAVAEFIMKSYKNLEEEAVMGQTKYTTAMLSIMNCSKNDHSAIASGIQAQFKNQMTNSNYKVQSDVQKAQSLYHIVNTTVEKRFPTSCGA